MKTPAEIIDRAVGRPYAHIEVLRELGREGYILLRVEHSVTKEAITDADSR